MSVLRVLRMGLVIGLVALALSCDVAGGLFSRSELSDMYEVWIDIDGLTLLDGDLVRSDSNLVPVIESQSGMSNPGKLSLVLSDMDGYEAARLGFVATSGVVVDSDDPSLRTVGSLQGSLPSFSVPEDLPEGYYYLEAQLYDPVGRILSSTTTLVLVYNGAIPSPRIETFPSSPAKGQPVFLRLDTGLTGAHDPWLRWYVGGGIRKEGYASDFADRLVWQIPESDGFFSVRAELFPFKPPLGISNRSISAIKSRPSTFRADLILAVGSARAARPFDGIERAYSLDFKANPEAQKVELPDGSTLPALMMGSPHLESHESGYGHALEAGAGYLIPGTIIPRTGLPFTLSMAFDPSDVLAASGALVTLFSTDGTPPVLRLGISGGLPYLEAGDSIVQAFVGLSTGLSYLVLEVVPLGEDTTEAIVSLFLNHELVGNGVISSSPFAFAGPVMTLVGGPEGLDAVYDDLAVIDGRYQAFFFAKAHEFGSSLVAASGFEGGSPGKGIVAYGPVEAGDGFIELRLDSSLEIPVPAGGFTFDGEGYGASLELALVMEDGSLLVLSAGNSIPGVQPEWDAGVMAGTASRPTEETVKAGETSTVGFLQPVGGMVLPDQSLSLSVEVVAGGLRISDAAGRNEKIPTSAAASLLRLRPAGPDPLTIKSILVRAFSSVDSSSRVAGFVPFPQMEAGN